MFLSRNHDNACINDGRQEEGHIDKSYKARFKRLKKAFSDPLTKVHVPFKLMHCHCSPITSNFCRDLIHLY